MTMSRGASRILYLGNGQATEFSFPFRVWDENQLSVLITGPDGKSRAGSGWSARLDENGGIIRYLHEGAPLPDGWKLAIMRNMPFVQEVDLITGTRFDPEVLETALDVATAERQQLLETLERAIVVEPTSGESPQDLLAGIFSSRDTAVNSAASAAASAQSAGTAAAEATGSADAARASELAAAASAASAADVVPLATPTLPGKVMPQTGDSDGLTLDANGSLKARIATTAQPGIVRPDGTTITAGDTGIITANGPLLQCNRRLVITASGSWTSPVSGWARVTCIGGGGAGGSQARTNDGEPCGGNAGGTTSFGALLSAAGGSGGGGGASSRSGGGGGAGKVNIGYILLQKDQTYLLTVGAGGLISTVPGVPTGPEAGFQNNNGSGQGAKNSVGGFSSDYAYMGTYGWMTHGNGGNGEWNATGFGGGGAGNCAGTGGTTGTNYPGLPGRGGDNGQDSPASNGTPNNNNGGNGGDGAIIIEFFDPEYDPDTEPDTPDNNEEAA